MWWNQCAIDRGKDFRGSNDRPIRFDPLRIAIDQLIDMRAEQDSETHQLLYHVDDPVIIARRLHPSGLVEFGIGFGRSEEHTSELQSLMRISYAVFCFKKKKIYNIQ